MHNVHYSALSAQQFPGYVIDVRLSSLKPDLSDLAPGQYSGQKHHNCVCRLEVIGKSIEYESQNCSLIYGLRAYDDIIQRGENGG